MFNRFLRFHLFWIPCFWLNGGLAQAATDCAVNRTPKIECEALLALYNSTNGPNWASKVDWNVTNDPCAWIGITCSSTWKNIIKIHLTSNRLSGSLPPELGNLVNLEELDLSENHLSGSLPPEWGKLGKLQELNLSSNQLGGSLPLEWSKLVNLQELNLLSNQLSGPLPPEWGNLVNLRQLNLSENYLSGSLPPEWGKLGKLQELNLSSNQLGGFLPPEWGNLVNLQELNLLSNQLSGSLPLEWGNLVNLQKLNLSSNQLGGSLPPKWSKLGKLQELNLSSNQLGGSLPPEWGNLVNLRQLNLSENYLRGSLPLEWGKLGKSWELNLSSNELSGSLPLEWGNLVNLQVLILYFNQLNGSLPPEWGNLVNLRELNLLYNQLSGFLPPEWGKLDKLQDLNLLSNHLSGPLPPKWGNLVNLRQLNLSENYLSGSLPLEWDKLGRLQDLNLSSNKLSGSLPPEWGNLVNLKKISLNSNQLTGNIPETFTHLVNLYYLNLDYNLFMAPDWQETQTVPPTAVTATEVTNDSIQVQWTPIPYQDNGGYYEVGYATTPGGPYTFQPASGDRRTITHLITSLSPNTSYYIVVRTYTPPHYFNQNPQTSGISAEVSVITRVKNYFLSITLNGQGTVTSTPAGIACKDDCSENYPSGATVTLTATPDPGYAFDTWSGACTGDLTSVNVILDATKACSATFISTPPPAFTCDRVIDVSQAECAALQTIYETTDGKHWNNPNGWLTDPVVANWEGVSVTAGQVTQLELASQNLVGTFPTAVCQLPHLSSLNLTGNTLTGTIPSCLGDQPLQSLDISYNQLQGPLTVTTGWLANEDLVQLKLDHNHLGKSECSAIQELQKRGNWNLEHSPQGNSFNFNIDCVNKTLPSLIITKLGSGHGFIKELGSSQVICDANCQQATRNYPANKRITLRATPYNGFQFKGWGQDCQGSQKISNVVLDVPIKKCTAEFVPTTEVRQLTVTLTGLGTVTAPWLTCTNSPCSVYYSRKQKKVKLVAIPSQPDVLFLGWGGDCQGLEPSVKVTLATDIQCTAYFQTYNPDDIFTLTVQKTGTGQGHVYAWLAGEVEASLVCRPSCQTHQAEYASGQHLILTAQPIEGSNFVGWEGDCAGSESREQLLMTGHKTCIAKFVADSK